MQPRFPSVAYVPDRFIVVVLSAVLTWRFGWDKKGLGILGTVQSSSGSPFPFRWPLQPSKIIHIKEAMGTSFLIALFGFFESSVAAKSLGGGGSQGVQNMSLSANRELVALGVANILGGCFMALPAFGGYGRSKVNASTGGQTPMSSIILSLVTVICILFLLPYFYYLPVGFIPTFPLYPIANLFPRKPSSQPWYLWLPTPLLKKPPMTSNSSSASAAGRNLLSCSSSSGPQSSTPFLLASPWVSVSPSSQSSDIQRNRAYKSWAKYQAHKTNLRTQKSTLKPSNSSKAA